MAANLKVGIDMDSSKMHNTLTGAKDDVLNFAAVGTQLEDRINSLEKSFDEAAARTDNYKASLRQMTKNITALTIEYRNMTDAERSSDFGQKTASEINRMTIQASNLKDTMGDVKEAIAHGASDTLYWSAGKDAISMMTGEAQSAIGVFTQLTGNTQAGTQAIAGLTAAQGGLNGVILAVNMAQGQSNILRAAGAAITSVFGTATTAAAIATRGLNIAMKANVFFAVAGLVLSLVMTIKELIDGEDKAKESTDNLTDAERAHREELKKNSDQINTAYLGTLTKLYTNYDILRAQYKKLTSDHERTEWIEKNKNKFHELGLSVNGVTSAESVFVNNTSKVIDSFKKRAEAAALEAQLEQEYSKNIRLRDKAESWYDTNNRAVADNIQKGQKVNFKDYTSGKLRQGDYTTVGNEHYYTAQGAAYQNYMNQKDFQQNAKNPYNNSIQQSNAHINKIAKELADISGSISESLGNLEYSENNNVKSTPKKTTTKKDKVTKKEPEKEPVEGTVDYYDKQIEKIEKEQKALAKDSTEWKKYQQQIDSLKAKKLEITGPDEKSKKDVEKEIKSIMDELNKPEDMEFDFSNLSESAQKEANKLLKELERIKKAMEELQKIVDNTNGSYSAEDIKKAQNEIKKLGGTYESTSKQVKQYSDISKKNKDKEDKTSKLTDSLKSVGSIAASTSQLFEAFGDKSAAAMMTVASSVADSVAVIIPQILKLIGVKEGEALSSGTASAAALPFPANLGAIATIVASIMGVISTISSTAKAADGGVFNFPTSIGDNNLVRVNGGEMFLNSGQQANLFRLLDGAPARQSTMPITHTIKVKGKDLYITLKNYNGYQKSIGKDIGIS